MDWEWNCAACHGPLILICTLLAKPFFALETLAVAGEVEFVCTAVLSSISFFKLPAAL